jgi:epoxyqueuosine reductase
VISPQYIKQVGHELGIDEIRITTAHPFTAEAEKIWEQKHEGLYLTSEYWYKRDFNSFCDVSTKLPRARSIVAACQCYLTDEVADHTAPGDPHGLIARYTWRNYYLDLRRRLRNLGGILKEKTGASFRVFSNGPIAEKPIAVRSGIGFYGKHSIIINHRYGSWIVLGELITDIDIEPDSPVSSNCGDCEKCIEACPTHAIIRPYIIDRRRCIQALTNSYRVIPSDIADVWGNRLYGCSICQDICPINENLQPTPPRTDVGYVGSSLPVLHILSMEEEDYRTTYANNQITASWICFNAIKRNALITLGHIKDPAALPILQEYAKDRDDVLAKTARWAITHFSHGS